MVAHPAAAAAAGILQEERINHGHDLQRRFPHRCQPVKERGPGQTQQGALPADAELWMIVIEQLAKLTRVKAAENLFLNTPTPSAACRSAGKAQPP
jgi:hypothetical protein